MLVTDYVLQPAAEHSRQHHPQRHETGANRIMGGFMLAARDVDHVEHVCGEAKAVAELLDCHA